MITLQLPLAKSTFNNTQVKLQVVIMTPNISDLFFFNINNFYI